MGWELSDEMAADVAVSSGWIANTKEARAAFIAGHSVWDDHGEPVMPVVDPF